MVTGLGLRWAEVDEAVYSARCYCSATEEALRVLHRRLSRVSVPAGSDWQDELASLREKVEDAVVSDVELSRELVQIENMVDAIGEMIREWEVEREG